MNPELQAKLVTYLDGLEKGAAKVGEFAEREIPETIREWLLWLAIENFAYAAACLAACIVCVVAIRKAAKSVGGLANIGPQNDTPFPAITVAFGFTGLFLLAPSGGRFAMQGVKVIVAPRVVIVEKVAELTKK